MGAWGQGSWVSLPNGAWVSSQRFQSVCSHTLFSESIRMGSKAKLLLLVALMVGTASVVAQKTTNQPITGNTCQVVQGPPGPPGTCSYTEVSLVKGVKDINTSLKDSVKNLTDELTGALERIEQAMTKCNTEEPPCPRSLGLTSYKPAKSCREIFRCNPSSPSGYYWLKSDTTECREVFCDMETTHCNIKGGWMRVVYFNMSEPGASCPASLRQINTPAKLCGRRTAPGCSSVTYPVDGIHYSKVCGQARGYQYFTPDAFQSPTNDINSYYVDGVSITYGNPRHHLWTYASGLSDDYNYGGVYNCPCAKYPGPNPPAFVGLDYYCESGITGRYQDNQRITFEDPLWDGDGCGPGNTCCAQAGMPWFCRTLPHEVSEDIEMRICGDEVTANEEIYVELVEVYVQ